MTIRLPSRLRWLVLATLGLALVAGLVADRWASGRARAVADDAAATAARSHVGVLQSELQKFRLLPLVLTEYPGVAAALAGDAEAARALDRTFELLAARTDAADLYAIDASGRTVAASNWRKPTSFVGQNYGFRPYFQGAMLRGASELFALGTVSGRPGLYLARRVEQRGRALGVIVVKVEFDGLEAGWARTSGASFVVDPRGVILVTSEPRLRFRTIGPVDPALVATARQTLQFGAAPPVPAPITIVGRAATATLGGDTARYRLSSMPAPLTGARLIHLAPLEPPLAAARIAAALVALALVLVAGIVAALLLRARDTRRLQAEARAALEGEVSRRTAELRDANVALRRESEERLIADRRYREAREELAQANRLGTLGQVTAGVAHEINQPVAAIRAFAENGATFLDRGAPQDARDNLRQIVALADRIGTITGELRSFARRRTRGGGTTRVGDALDGALLLVGERGRGVMLGGDARDTVVRGDRIRIEQILVNLLQNALDATASLPHARVSIDARRDGDRVTIAVTDTGAGIDAAIADQLFTPFTTGKTDGLGLGLAIARDIARDLGGELSHRPTATGAAFDLELAVAR
ncbi:ATP-binding protein [Sphingomonas donggukensis]|uniref:histidine kinase n=1 Tax=Sphingomonas donggukensis TaxID=2949093 RepID=A0ABY4TY06_9SPHN|nr:ATP-binding protein [Sphingomonas donggukensis]URW76407.1 ATP-binding protein [Sphingomonas donggukensis]